MLLLLVLLLLLSLGCAFPSGENSEHQIIRPNKYYKCKCGSSIDTISRSNMSIISSDAESFPIECGADGHCLAVTCYHIYNAIGTAEAGDSYRFASSFGCMNWTEVDPQYLFSCFSPLKDEYVSCCRGDLCNSERNISSEALDKLIEEGSGGDSTPIIARAVSLKSPILISTILLVVLLVLLAAIVLCRRRKDVPSSLRKIISSSLRHLKVNRSDFIPVNNPRLYDQLIQKGAKMPPATTGFEDLLDTSNLNQVIEEFSGSGSGSGLPLLVQRTLARQIRLVDIIGKGRFGEVWQGTWHDDPVAVKIFSARDERSWFRETEIYQTALIRHANILGFIAADNIDTGAWTQLWLVTDYYADGSLYDYLVKKTVGVDVLLRMMCSIATGLNHLHMQIDGCEGKPAIAHRDLKSKNVLVKSDLSCCIADFGLAVKHDSRHNKIDILPNSKAGTNRYMSPECLEGSLNVNSFDSFKQSDVYSMSLVMWEICYRCSETVPTMCYCPPYGEYTNADPTLDEVREIVCAKRLRPTMSEQWFSHPVLQKVVRIMKECWYDEPSARLSALRIKKSLNLMIVNLRNASAQQI